MDLTTRVNDLLAEGEPFCLGTVIESLDTKINPGLKFIVRSDGSMEGGFESQPLDKSAREMALQVLVEKNAAWWKSKAGCMSFWIFSNLKRDWLFAAPDTSPYPWREMPETWDLKSP